MAVLKPGPLKTADTAVRAAIPATALASGAVVVAGLRKSYGAVQAVRGVSFTVAHGEIFALLGPNGAGKTTTLEILEGFRTRDAGRVEVLGYDPGDRATGRALRERIGLVLQDIAVEPYLTVRETIARNAGYYPAPRDTGEVIGLARPGRAGAKEGPEPFRRPEAAPGSGPGPDWRTGPAVPGRADDRVRSECAPRGVGGRPRPARRGRHDRAHHPLHGRGAGPGRPGGGDLRRADRSPGHAVGHRRTRHRPVAHPLRPARGIHRRGSARRCRVGRRPGHRGDRRADTSWGCWRTASWSGCRSGPGRPPPRAAGPPAPAPGRAGPAPAAPGRGQGIPAHGGNRVHLLHRGRSLVPSARLRPGRPGQAAAVPAGPGRG